MRNLWLIFAQTATVAVSVLFVVTTLKPEWLGRSGSGLQVVELRQAASSAGLPARAASYSDAVRKAVPSVVNIFTSKEIKTPRHPFLDDPLFRHFFGDRLEEEPQRAASLGSGVIVSPKGYILTNHHVVEADRKSTRLNSSHQIISYAVFCLKKKTRTPEHATHTTTRRLP